jgi:hypothetical protein
MQHTEKTVQCIDICDSVKEDLFQICSLTFICFVLAALTLTHALHTNTYMNFYHFETVDCYVSKLIITSLGYSGNYSIHVVLEIPVVPSSFFGIIV